MGSWRTIAQLGMGWFHGKTTEYLQLSVFTQGLEMSVRTKLAIILTPCLRTVFGDFSFRIKWAKTHTVSNLFPKEVTSFANSLLNPGIPASTAEDTEREETPGLKAKHIHRTDGRLGRYKSSLVGTASFREDAREQINSLRLLNRS